MNRHDIILIIIITIISILSIIYIPFLNKEGSKEAVVYYENDVVLNIDLTKKGKHSYTVKGKNGDVVIISDFNKVKVKQENSPLHICSKQGYISASYETIVCLPNKIVVKIEAKQELDGVIK